ncbi:sulfatase-like hydrolase/transferase [Christensenellaceae bacterium OttesenSCG-928-K19]|nr:sulfatase-like hydrolase/transferase [Christensenellaceae bacterium OttesenSCG-928-K19]
MEKEVAKKEIKHFKKSPLALFFFYLGDIVLLECVVRFALDVPFAGIGILFLLLFGSSLALLFTAICFLLPAKAGFVLSHVFMGLLMALYIVQLFYYSIFGTFLTVFSMLNGGDAMQYGDTIWTTLAQVWPFIALIALPGVVNIFFCKRLVFGRSVKTAIIAAALAVGVHFAGVGSIFAVGTGYFSPYEYYFHNSALTQSVDKLGLFTTVRLDVQRYLFGLPDMPPVQQEVQEEQQLEQTPEQEAQTPTPVPEQAGEAPAEEEAAIVEYGYNELEIDFDALMAQEEDAAIAGMHEYFGRLSPTRQNEHTGMFEGYNLITITAEAFAPYAIDKDLTPTLYKMQQEGFHFTNFYCPEWAVSTSDGEYVNCQGLIPKTGIWSMYMTAQKENYIPFTMGNQFSALGYQTNAYHNNSHTYYKRNISHPYMGYTFTAVGNGLEIEDTWPQSDYQMVEASLPDYIGDKPFHTYFMTVSGHMLYTWDGNAMSRKYRDLVEDLPLSEESAAYLACNIELDRAVELLLGELEKAGIADKTVISISPDHPPYGLSTDSISELIGHELERNFEYNESAWLLYCPGMEPEQIDEPCCSLDILPTLSNLFGLPYDSRLLMGRDVFSDAEPLAILGDRSWVTERARFNANTGEATMADGSEVDQAYIERINKTVADKFVYSPQIYDYDYYRIVLKPEEEAQEP